MTSRSLLRYYCGRRTTTSGALRRFHTSSRRYDGGARFQSILKRSDERDPLSIFIGKRLLCVALLMYIQDPIELNPRANSPFSFSLPSFSNPFSDLFGKEEEPKYEPIPVPEIKLGDIDLDDESDK